MEESFNTIEKKDKSQEVLEMTKYLKEGLRLIKYSIEILRGKNLTKDEIIKRAENIFDYSQKSLDKCQTFLESNLLNQDEIIKGKPDISLYVFDAIHTLKNDFSNPNGFCRIIIKEGATQEELEEYISAMEVSIGEASTILEKLSKFDNFLEDKMEYNLCGDINNLIIGLERKANLKKIEIINKINPNIDIETYKYKLNSILLNLISNAIKFTNKGGSIEVLGENENGTIEISVKDNGVGLLEDQKNKLFDNIGISTKGTNNEEGTGFGLSICKAMAEKMGGDLRVESEGEGKGSTFILTLPIEEKSKE